MPDATITFSVSGFLWFCGAICTVAAAIAVLYKAANKAQEPEKIQNERLDALEQQVKKFGEYLIGTTSEDTPNIRALYGEGLPAGTYRGSFVYITT